MITFGRGGVPPLLSKKNLCKKNKISNVFRNINKSYCFNGKFDALNIASIRFVRAYANSNQDILYSINKPITDNYHDGIRSDAQSQHCC